MQAPPAFGFEQLIAELLRGIADTLVGRPGETETQCFTRHQAIIFSVMAFLPRDALETMMAGQCVTFDHLVRDATHDLLRAEAEPVKRRIRSQIIGLGRIFLKHLDHLCQLQTRLVEQPAASDGDPASPPNPYRRTADIAASVAAEPGPPQPQSVAAEADASEPPTMAPDGKAALLQQHGFQNRRMRRAMQFKKPVKKAASQRTAGVGT